MATTKKKPAKSGRLGKGLSSLMGASAPPRKPFAGPTSPDDEVPLKASGGADSVDPVDPADSSAGSDAAEADGAEQPPARVLPVTAIVPNRHQPRQRFDEAALRSLADSIRQHGVMQPVVVRPMPDEPDRYELVAGERRWRAAQEAGLDHLPAVVAALDDQSLAEWALIENLQREDLNPIDRAEAFQRLADLFNLPHDAIATRVGLERSTVTNLLRLLDLSEYVQGLVRDDLLSMGQARAIAGADDPSAQRALAQRAVKEGLSVRQVEAAVRGLAQEGDEEADGRGGDGRTGGIHRGREGGKGGGGGAGASASPHLQDLERQVAQQLGTKVHLRTGKKSGTGSITIEFYSIDQFDALMDKLGVETDA